MRPRTTPLLVLIAALLALGLSAAWAASRATNDSHHYGPMYGRGMTMMGSGGHRAAWYVDGNGKRVTDLNAARARAQKFADRLGLKTDEVMRFANNYYVLLIDKQGKPATEVLVDPRTGAVTLEYGPAMMWNTRYGMMTGASRGGMMGGGSGGGMMGSGSGGGMMGGGSNGMMGNGSNGMMGRYGGAPNWTPPTGTVPGPVTAAGAEQIATRWLAQQGNGQTVGQPDALPGYFTFETLKDGKTTGMLSVNGSTGAVWDHWWHGAFVKSGG